MNHYFPNCQIILKSMNTASCHPDVLEFLVHLRSLHCTEIQYLSKERWIVCRCFPVSHRMRLDLSFQGRDLSWGDGAPGEAQWMQKLHETLILAIYRQLCSPSFNPWKPPPAFLCVPTYAESWDSSREVTEEAKLWFLRDWDGSQDILLLSEKTLSFPNGHQSQCEGCCLELRGY